MKRFAKAISALLCAALLFGAAACAKDPGDSGEVYEPYDYTVRHQSIDNVLRFYSSDNRLDAFLNEYFERHMRYDEDLRVHTFPVGGGQPVWKEWESMIGSFWDASPANVGDYYATNRWMRDWLALDYMSVQDRQGYISTSTGVTTDDWGQGWSFPSYRHSRRGGSYGEEFAVDAAGWTGEIGTDVSFVTGGADGNPQTAGEEGYLVAENTALSDEVAVLSPALLNGTGMNAFYSPFLHFSWSFDILEGSAEDIDDLYVYFQTASDGTWSEDKCVRYSEYATVVHPFADSENTPQGTFLNMYLNGKWGRDSGGSNRVTRLKFVLRAKKDTQVRARLYFNFIRADFDDRMSDNCGQYISAAKHYLSYTQDAEFLAQVLPVARRAMQFYLTCLDGAENGIISNAYLVGHFNSGTAGVGVGIGDGFWDAVSFPNTNLYSNLSYHQALVGMIYLEEMAAAYGVTAEPVSVLGKDMKTSVPYAETAETLREKLALCEQKMRETFWDEEKGRFFAGYYDTADGSGVTDRKMDYGFLMFNLQAVTDGIATDAQAERILSWLCGERTIEGDDSMGEDLYKFRFAPRFSTRHNGTDSTWAVGQAAYWEVGVRDGGAVMQTSYYDLVARSAVRGADDAFSRLQGIQAFYYDVRAAGGTGQDFYRVYFREQGIGMQGNYDADGDGVADGDNEGPVGIDCEFLEAALLFVSVPDAFFGMEPLSDGTLRVCPNMPSALDYWRMENLLFGGVAYDLSIGKYFVQVSNVTADSDLSFRAELVKPSFAFTVRCNGAEVPYTEEDGRVVVTVPFGNCKIEIVGA